jgi:acetoacetyl-CoA synthetase
MSSVLWSPSEEDLTESGMAHFINFVNETYHLDLPLDDYAQVHTWSIENLADFWDSIAAFAHINFTTTANTPLEDRGVEFSQWFPGATLNYAERALAITDQTPAESVAIIAVREGGPTTELTLGELRSQVRRAQSGLIGLGVGKGDRVVGLLPNSPEAVISFLAAASLGAIWSSCSPEFGAEAILERFSQLEPTVFIAVDGYRFGGKEFNITHLVESISQQISSLNGTVLIPYLEGGDDAEVAGLISWSRFTSEGDAPDQELVFAPVPFEHPLWVLFSSGTTGLPKGIVQGHGGILLEHFKNLRLHHDLRPGKKFFWYTTTGWMMWNYLVSGLLVGTTIVLFDGSPAYPDLRRLWSLAEEHKIDFMGVSAPLIHACMKEGMEPAREFDLRQLTTIGSTGAPLSPEAFTWVGREVGKEIQVCSTSGGTDVCTAFLISSPNVPIWSGELSCAALGVDAQSLNADGVSVVGEVGELVLMAPMPSMPVSFWNDADGTKLHEAYFDYLPGVWRHGDWSIHTEHGSFILLGRSDATLNRGGVRMGTAEFYRVAEAVPGVVDCLVVDIPKDGAAGDGELVCFVVLSAGKGLTDCEPELRNRLRTALSPRHVPDRFVVVDVIPKTLNGKKCEVPVKRILMGEDPERVINRDSLQSPASIDFFVAMSKHSIPEKRRN